MGQPERDPRHAHLARLLVLLFSIVLLLTVFFPQSAARDMLPAIAGLLALAIRAHYRAGQR